MQYIERISTTLIPEEYQLDYLRCNKRINEIMDKLVNFDPETYDDYAREDFLLREYEFYFKKLAKISEALNSNIIKL